MKSSLNTKLAAMMLLLSLSIIAMLIVLYYKAERPLYAEFERQTAELSKAIKIGLDEAVRAGGDSGQRTLEKYLKELNAKGINEISVISTTDRIIASTNQKDVGKWITKSKKDLIARAEIGEPLTADGKMYNVVMPVISGDKHMGYIHLRLDAKDLSVFLRAGAIRRVVAAIVIFGIGTILAMMLARWYTRPIDEMVKAARRVAAGDLSQELQTSRTDEMGELAKNFNYMIGKLKEERGLREKLRKAEHLAGIEQFAKSIAHEIKNPLNFISLSIDHMKETHRPVDPEAAAKFDSMLLNMKQEIQRISRYSESFLEYGRGFELNIRPTDSSALINSVLELVAAQAEKEKIEVVTRIERSAMIEMDPDLIRTCMYNIIINALQSMQPRGGGRLTVGALHDNGTFKMTFEDTGVGIDKDKIGKVFDPYFTVKTKGLGLGLAFTKRVMEEHGGKVGFMSEAGKGSVVTLSLPLNGSISNLNGGSAN